MLKSFEEIFAVVKALNLLDIEFWTLHGEDQDGTKGVSLCLNANDFFYWGCADAEPVEYRDLELFQKCKNDLLEAGIEDYYVDDLFMCRKRGMRPQKPVFDKMFPKLKEIISKEFPER
jgi:hypothetical protein